MSIVSSSDTRPILSKSDFLKASFIGCNGLRGNPPVIIEQVRPAGRTNKKPRDACTNPAELDKCLYAGFIYAKCVDKSATDTNVTGHGKMKNYEKR